MLNITNRKNNYQSRSKKYSNPMYITEIKIEEKKSRKSYKVDRNGYFVWDSLCEAKKI